MQQYKDLLRNVYYNGTFKGDRTNTGVKSLFSPPDLEFDLSDNKFPLVTTKKIHLKSIIYELLWFLRGEENISFLKENNITIWDEWADPFGNVGPIYGPQWRNWDGNIDQIYNLIKEIKNNPNSRRHIVSAWNVSELPNMALPPCHMMFQCYVNYPELHLKMTQRSADLFLGVPFNIASYALLLKMLAQVCNLRPGRLILSFGDVHIYSNHMNQVYEQLNRSPYPSPKLILNEEVTNIDEFEYEDFTLIDYQYHPPIKAPIAV